MRFLSLFAGIGGFDLGLERASMTCVGQCEIDPFCRAVLAKHWPNVWRWDDVRTLTAELVEQHCGPIDLICGGFPCQDISSVGERARIEGGERSGLWRDFARLIGEIRPGVALVENVSALLEWDLGTVLRDLAGIGFDAEWEHLPAGAFGAPHLRRRIFLAAYPQGDTRAGSYLQGAPRQGPPILHRKSGGGFGGHVPGSYWEETQPGLVEVDDGISTWAHEVSGLGNAVVPQVAEYVGRLIMEATDPR